MCQHLSEAAAGGRLADAALVFHTLVCNENEIAALGSGYFERCGASVPGVSFFESVDGG